MERDTTNHPSPAQIASGAELTDDQLDALTPEQRERLTSGDPLPVDPRSPTLDQADPISRGELVVDDWTDHKVSDPEHVAADELTVDGAPVDPNAGGDYDGDGKVEHVIEHEVVDADAQYDGGNGEPREGLLLDDAQPDDESA